MSDINLLRAYIGQELGGLRKLNSMTKYPSIPTYHEMGEKGRLSEGTPLDMGHHPLLVTEKVDGTSGRIILTPHGWLIGSREELLQARGDIVWNPALGIVEVLRHWAEEMWQETKEFIKGVVVVYPEVYGGRTTKSARNYTVEKDQFNASVFDIATFTPGMIGDLKLMEGVTLAAWREHTDNRVRFLAQGLDGFIGRVNLPNDLSAVPRSCVVKGLPDGIEDVQAWMNAMVTAAPPDQFLSIKKERIEGFVVRSLGGTQIAKVRFQDYQRTLRKGSMGCKVTP